MTVARLLVAGVFALVACSHGAPIVQTGAPTSVPHKDSAAAETGFWSDTIRPFTSLSRGWNRIPGRYGTGCAHDSTYAFKVRPGLPDKVLIYLNGGGACWRAQDCDRHHATYTMTADSANDVSARVGVFDYNNDRNPFRDYTMVFVSYCTGDMHLGTREVDYEATAAAKGSKAKREFSVRHGGAANLEAVLDWVYANLRSPRTVFVAGSNAGAVASPIVAQRIARHYPRARVAQFGESAGAYHSADAPSILAAWGASEYLQHDAGFRSLDSADFSFERLYIASGNAAPRVHFAQFNSVDDASQLAMLAAFGVKGVPVRKQLASNLADLRDSLPWFHTYTAPGKASSILRSGTFYTTTVGGVKFVDWLTGLADGDEIDDVGSALLAGKPVPPI